MAPLSGTGVPPRSMAVHRAKSTSGAPFVITRIPCGPWWAVVILFRAEVAQSAADMVLTDDDFSTIVAAVREGRGIYQNIRKTVHFLLSCNIGEILVVFAAFLLQVPTPLLAIQLLWVNLVTDSLPALALGADPIRSDVMRDPPHKREEGLFSGGMGFSLAVEGCLVGALALLAYTLGRAFFDENPAEPVVGRTMAFCVLSLSQLVHSFNMRSESSKIGSKRQSTRAGPSRRASWEKACTRCCSGGRWGSQESSNAVIVY